MVKSPYMGHTDPTFPEKSLCMYRQPVQFWKKVFIYGYLRQYISGRKFMYGYLTQSNQLLVTTSSQPPPRGQPHRQDMGDGRDGWVCMDGRAGRQTRGRGGRASGQAAGVDGRVNILGVDCSGAMLGVNRMALGSKCRMFEL